MDTELKDKLQPRSFTQDHYDMTLGLRNRLAAVADQNRSKYRFNAIEYAALAFALRVARRFNKLQTPVSLDEKIERYRKRAKRGTIAAAGHAAYRQAADQWAHSSRWIRFNLLPLPLERGYRYHKPRKIYRQQFQTMFGFAQTVIGERCREPLPEGVVARLTRLIIREIRRRRHPRVTVRELVSDEQRAKEFLFRLIRKKKEDLKLRFEFMSPLEQWAERSERYRSAMIIESDLTEAPRPEAQPLCFPEQDLICRIGLFLKHAVAPRYWDSLLTLASSIARNSSLIPEGRRLCGDLEEVVRKAQPMGTFKPGFDELEYLAAWLVHFLYQCGADHEVCLELLRRGMKLEVGRRAAAA
jgi:hypothetical protein